MAQAALVDQQLYEVPESSEPVKVPADALILPYDPDSKTGIQEADRVLVPYDKYVELWNRAHPDKRLETKLPPLPYALAGAAYTATLQGEDFLRVEGQLEIDVLVERPVMIPLGLSGGVLARADLDGQPARLSLASVPATVPRRRTMGRVCQPSGTALTGAVRRPTVAPALRTYACAPGCGWPGGGSLLTFWSAGKGRHRLDCSKSA